VKDCDDKLTGFMRAYFRNEIAKRGLPPREELNDMTYEEAFTLMDKENMALWKADNDKWYAVAGGRWPYVCDGWKFSSEYLSLNASEGDTAIEAIKKAIRWTDLKT